MADVDMTDAPAGAAVVKKKGADTDSKGDSKKRFEVKKVSVIPDESTFTIRTDMSKWNAVALWAWDIVVDNCAICRNHIMDLCSCRPLPSGLWIVPLLTSFLLP